MRGTMCIERRARRGELGGEVVRGGRRGARPSRTRRRLGLWELSRWDESPFPRLIDEIWIGDGEREIGIEGDRWAPIFARVGFEI